MEPCLMFQWYIFLLVNTKFIVDESFTIHPDVSSVLNVGKLDV